MQFCLSSSCVSLLTFNTKRLKPTGLPERIALRLEPLKCVHREHNNNNNNINNYEQAQAFCGLISVILLNKHELKMLPGVGKYRKEK